MKINLSIIVLTYNSSSTMRQCLESFQEQTDRRFKLIIVDDESKDDTLKIVESFKKKLNITVLKNGAHNISKGRNIGLDAVNTEYVAFIDSDAYADQKWVESIYSSLDRHDAPALLAGRVINEFSTDTARAIAVNDETIRDLFWKGTLLLQGCNFALDFKALKYLRFDENFIHAEDLDYTWKVQKSHKWLYVEDMVVHHQSRGSLRQYHRQMYKYGMWKLFYERRAGYINWIDFVPIVVFLASVLVALIMSPYAIFTYPLFCLSEAIFVVVLKRPPISYVPKILAAWFIKNTSWSLGTIKGIILIASRPKLRAMIDEKI